MKLNLLKSGINLGKAIEKGEGGFLALGFLLEDIL